MKFEVVRPAGAGKRMLWMPVYDGPALSLSP
jgi:hypothetical protein